MKRSVITGEQLRSGLAGYTGGEIPVPEDCIFTPDAMDYIREHGIRLVKCADAEETAQDCAHRYQTMSRELPGGDMKHFVDYISGEPLSEKPEYMTHMRGNLLISKESPRIAFRGKLDSLMSDVLLLQDACEKEQLHSITGELEEILGYLRKILAAEVKNQPLEEQKLQGMTEQEIRYHSQHVREYLGMDHPVPEFSMGRIGLLLNSLRTRIRETELSAIRAFPYGSANERTDIIKGLNRLSSLIYIMFCRYISGRYTRE